MATFKKLKGVSKKTKDQLLAGESQFIDYKQRPSGISMDDLVAFANTGIGGCILVGVEEKKTDDGTTIGNIVGCEPDDQTLLTIQNKALECIPPVPIGFTIENTSDKAIIVVNVGASTAAPHSTRKGVYCIRDGSRNRPLQPNELLKIFLETEASEFRNRFRSVTTDIQFAISEMAEEVSKQVRNVEDQLGWSDMNLNDATSALQDLHARFSMIQKRSEDTQLRFRALFEQDNRGDPVKVKYKNELKERVAEQVKEQPEILEHIKEGGTISVQPSGLAAEELSNQEVDEIVRQLLRDLLAAEHETTNVE